MCESDAMLQVLIEAAAIAAHEVNRVWCEHCGDDSQVPWPQAPEWQKKSAISGVKVVYRNPDITPADQHECWRSEKERDGWIYGPVKDAKQKTHPCMVPYEELPTEQKVKDAFFGAVVRAVLGFTK